VWIVFRFTGIKFCACHCTDLASKVALAGVAELKEVGVGLVLEYD
jgi:metal-dependent hydrolase (beta-lactamase superfamily II)